ncbi:hypothetical protein DESC_480061 [Desulfosarcina cetonica]|nr:hypothetical protein DESC_480061 [Desulfosarcina cetonica]
MVMVADDIADLSHQRRAGAQPFQDLARHGRAFLFLVFSLTAAVFLLGLDDADVVQVGGTQYHGRVAALDAADPLGVTRHPDGVADTLEVALEIALHLDGHTVLEQIIGLEQEFLGQRADALLGILAVGRTAEIHVRIDEPVLAFWAFAGRVVLKKLDAGAAFGACHLKDGAGLPIEGILSWAFHGGAPFFGFRVAAAGNPAAIFFTHVKVSIVFPDDRG